MLEERSSSMRENSVKNPKGAGRKKIQLDESMLLKLAELHCNWKEIAYVMDVSVDTLKRNYADIIDKGYALGKIKLRRAMMRNACENDNAVMQIFLAKNLLGMENDPGATRDDALVLPWETEGE